MAPSKNVRSCGCLQREAVAKTNQSKRKYEPVVGSAMYVWRDGGYNDGDCDFESFMKLSQLPCFYCGRKPFRSVNRGDNRAKSDRQKQEGNFIYNGLDRVDNSKGHMMSNVVPCCSDCNYAKRNMTVDQFRELITMIYNHWILPIS